MKVAVWDTYVKSHTGDVLHFDIIVPQAIRDTGTVLDFGKAHLQSIGEGAASLSTAECRFCHIEEPSNEIREGILQKGHFILEMDSIPAVLPDNASRREKILFLKGHYPNYRFKSFSGVSEEEISGLLLNAAS